MLTSGEVAADQVNADSSSFLAPVLPLFVASGGRPVFSPLDPCRSLLLLLKQLKQLKSSHSTLASSALPLSRQVTFAAIRHSSRSSQARSTAHGPPPVAPPSSLVQRPNRPPPPRCLSRRSLPASYRCLPNRRPAIDRPPARSTTCRHRRRSCQACQARPAAAFLHRPLWPTGSRHLSSSAQFSKVETCRRSLPPRAPHRSGQWRTGGPRLRRLPSATRRRRSRQLAGRRLSAVTASSRRSPATSTILAHLRHRVQSPHPRPPCGRRMAAAEPVSQPRSAASSSRRPSGRAA